MYARRTVSRLPPELAGTAREDIETGLVSKGRNLPGFNGGYWLINPTTGEALAFTFFDTQENLEGSAARAGQLRAFAASNIGAQMGGVRHFEVVAASGHKVQRQASHARVLNFEGAPARLDEAIKTIPEKPLLPGRAFAGSLGVFWLADREYGLGVCITLFDSAASLADTRDHATEFRAKRSAHIPGAFSEFAEYEIVAVEEAPARAGAPE
jgi:hypothetical protein